MKKLSKAQQTVVDKMRDGWELHYSYLVKGGNLAYVNAHTRKALFRMKVLDNKPYYRLTEQYKTAPPVEGK